MVPSSRLIMLTAPVRDCWANAIEGAVASMAPANISFASFIEISRFSGASAISRIAQIGSAIVLAAFAQNEAGP
jgi:hypothetical protein